MLPRWKTLLCWLQALLLVIPQFAVYHYGLKQKVDRAAIGLTSVNDVMFAPVEADALQVSDAERSRCRQWYDSHIRTAQNPAYDFTVGGRSLRRHLRDWEINVGEEGVPDDRGGKTTLVALRHKESGLRARVEATIFEAEAACGIFGGKPSPEVHGRRIVENVFCLGKDGKPQEHMDIAFVEIRTHFPVNLFVEAPADDDLLDGNQAADGVEPGDDLLCGKGGRLPVADGNLHDVLRRRLLRLRRATSPEEAKENQEKKNGKE